MSTDTATNNKMPVSSKHSHTISVRPKRKCTMKAVKTLTGNEQKKTSKTKRTKLSEPTRSKYQASQDQAECQNDESKTSQESGQVQMPNNSHNNKWNHLPHTALFRIFWYLNPVDLINASATCKLWRECYFYPNLWREIQLCRLDWFLCKNQWVRARLVVEEFAKYARSVSIFSFTNLSLRLLLDEFDFVKIVGRNNVLSKTFAQHKDAIEQVSSELLDMLEKVSRECKNLEMLQMKFPENPMLQGTRACFGIGEENVKEGEFPDTKDLLLEKIISILGKSPSMKHLKLGYCMDVVGRPGRLEQVAKLCGKTLKTLHCPVFLIRNVYQEPLPNLEPFKVLAKLTDLRLNLLYVTDQLLEILASPDHCPMTSLGILATLEEDRDDTGTGTSNKAWEKLVAHSPELQVGVSYHIGRRFGDTANLESLLYKTAIPLHQLKIVCPKTLPGTVFQLIQNNFDDVLHHLELIYVNEYYEAMPLTTFEQDTNPVVMTMWKCTKLKELIIAGFYLDSNDIVGIARLRGSKLDVLGIQGSCIEYEKPVNTKNALKKEVSKCLGKDWQPMDDTQSELILWEIMDRPLLPENDYGSGPVS